MYVCVCVCVCIFKYFSSYFPMVCSLQSASDKGEYGAAVY